MFNIFDCTRIQPNVSSVFKLKIMHLKYFQSNHYRIGQSTTSLLFIKSREHLTLAWSSSPSPRAPWCGSHHATSAAPSFGTPSPVSPAPEPPTSPFFFLLLLILLLTLPMLFYFLLDRSHWRRYILQVFICFLLPFRDLKPFSSMFLAATSSSILWRLAALKMFNLSSSRTRMSPSAYRVTT